MADRTSDLNYPDAPSGPSWPFRLTNALAVYKGSAVGVQRSTGLAVLWADTVGINWQGLCMKGATGSTSASPPVEADVDVSGRVVKRLAVTGVTAITDVGDKVFLTTDNIENGCTLTPTTNVKAVGEIVRWYSGTTCDVRFYTPSEYLNQALATDITLATGAGMYWMSFPFTFITSTAAIDVATAITIGHAFKIVKWSWIDGGTALVGASGSRVANMEIGTTDVGTAASTCTVVQAGTAQGRRIDGTTVTGALTGTATDTFSIEIASGGTDITAGNGAFHVQIQNTDTTAALNSIINGLNSNQ